MRAVNLIPSEQRSGARVGAGRSEGAAYAVLAVLVVVAGLALLYGKATRTVASSKTQAAALKIEAEHAQGEAAALGPYTAFAALREQREKVVATLVDQRFDWAHAIHEFGRVLSREVSISELNGTINNPAANATTTAAPATSSSTASSSAAASSTAASTTPAGSVPTFTIAGCATSQRAVAETMQRLRLIDGVSEVTLQSSSGGGPVTGATSGATSCGSGPVFQMTVTFDALPSAARSAAAAGAKTSSVADVGATASSVPPSTAASAAPSAASSAAPSSTGAAR